MAIGGGRRRGPRPAHPDNAGRVPVVDPPVAGVVVGGPPVNVNAYSVESGAMHAVAIPVVVEVKKTTPPATQADR